MTTWLGQVMVTIGIMTLIIAIRTDCKSDYWLNGYITTREVILFFAGSVLIVSGVVVMVAMQV